MQIVPNGLNNTVVIYYDRYKFPINSNGSVGGPAFSLAMVHLYVKQQGRLTVLRLYKGRSFCSSRVMLYYIQ